MSSLAVAMRRRVPVPENVKTPVHAAGVFD